MLEGMRVLKNKKGFTLIELSLSIVFIAILSLAEAEEVRNAIANADAGFISKASE